VTYRERCDVDLYEERYHDVVLQQRSTLGVWVVLSLGTTLIVVVSYLLYINLRVPVASSPSIERSLHILATPVPAPMLSLPALTSLSKSTRRNQTVTSIPQSRAANALLGGQGPALLPEEAWAAP
jgi:hypothetical protein